MHIIQLSACEENKDIYIREMQQNKLFVYPTDSLYGIWWLFSHENIQRIAEIKHREIWKKMNIIAPSWERIDNNFIVHNKDFLIDSLSQYHGVTFVLEPKNNSPIALYGASYDNNTIWVRILKHPFQHIISELWQPFISTSANHAWEPNIKKIEDLNPDIVAHTDYIIDWWEVIWIPSVLIFDSTKDILIR